jgi:peptidoglycan/LPS O-acetylase OafA/YrhL
LNPAAWFLFYLILLYFMFSVSLMVRDRYREAVWWFFSLLGISSFRFYFLVQLHILPLTLEFFAGALFFRHMKYFNAPPKIALIAFLGVAAGAAGLYYKTEEGFYRYLTYGVAAICLLASLVLVELRARVSLPAMIDKAADSSYALYLLHLAFIELFFQTGYRDWLLSMSGIPKYLGFFLYIMMIFGIARIFNLWCEQPVLHRLTRFWDGKKNVSKAGALQ